MHTEASLKRDLAAIIAETQKAKSASDQGYHDKALDGYRLTLKLITDLTSMLERDHKSFLARGRRGHAAACMDLQSHIIPVGALVMTEMGRSFAALDNHDRALEYYDLALPIVPDSAYLLMQKSLSLKALGRSQEARDCLNRVMDLGPNDPFAPWMRRDPARESGM